MATSWRVPWVVSATVVFVIAAAARLGIVFAGAGPGGNYGYDVSVYYAASDALIHGRLPYRDFVLLHPPALMLSLTPFALLGRLTTDHFGFIAANLSFSLLGAVNATVVVLIARRLGLGVRAAVAGGLFYAVWAGSVQAEYLSRLEPLGNFLLLIGIFALASARAGYTRGWFLGGLAFGAAASVKVWWIVPLVLVPVWVAIHTRDRRQVTRAALGAVFSMVLINGVFFALAPIQMFKMIVTEQLGRPSAGIGPGSRLNDMLNITVFHVHPGFFVEQVAQVAILIVMAGGLVLTMTVRQLRPLAVLLVAQLAFLFAAPSWFGFYADYVAPASALCVAIGTWRLFPPRHPVATVESGPPIGRRVPRALALSGAVIAVVAAVLASYSIAAGNEVFTFPGRQLRPAVADSRCVMSDSPMALIELNVLSRDLSNGCQNWVDVTGRTYGVDRASGSRIRNAKWQRDLYAYLSSGETLIIIRPGTGISKATLARLHRGGLVRSVRGHAVYRSPRLAP